jgi:hypothetical protein
MANRRLSMRKIKEVLRLHNKERRPGVCSGLILSLTFISVLKGKVWRRRIIKFIWGQR